MIIKRGKGERSEPSVEDGAKRTRRREARNAPQGVERAERKEGTPMGKKKKGLSPKEKAAMMKAAAKLIGSVAALLTAIALWR